MICITSEGENLNSLVDQRFARCSYFLFVDENKEEIVEAVPNSFKEDTHGAGVNAAQLVMEKKVQVLITGNIGPNALNIIKKAGIRVFSGFTGNVLDAIKNYKEGKLKTL